MASLPPDVLETLFEASREVREDSRVARANSEALMSRISRQRAAAADRRDARNAAQVPAREPR